MRTLAGLAACLILAGCAEPESSAPTASTDAEPAAAGSLEFVEDAGMESLLKDNPVVVVNFTADW